mgnify:CR=1 FL=1
MQRFLRGLGVTIIVVVLAACGNQTPAHTDTHSMDHDMAATSDKPYDLLFLDSMVAHHQGAITMAQHAHGGYAGLHRREYQLRYPLD